VLIKNNNNNNNMEKNIIKNIHLWECKSGDEYIIGT